MEEQTMVDSRIVGFRGIVALLSAMMVIAAGGNRVSAQTPFLGEIDLVPYNFSPTGWADCNGQLLPISTNTALFSLLGTMYGGDGKSNFALPDLRDRVPVGTGQGPGLSESVQGEVGGEYQHTLTIAEMPAHTHFLKADTALGTSPRPADMFLARNAAGIPSYRGGLNQAMSPSAIGVTGGSQPHNNLQPYLGLKYIIAIQGIFPARN